LSKGRGKKRVSASPAKKGKGNRGSPKKAKVFYVSHFPVPRFYYSVFGFGFWTWSLEHSLLSLLLSLKLTLDPVKPNLILKF
jgi:hypothetical protein